MYIISYEYLLCFGLLVEWFIESHLSQSAQCVSQCSTE